MGLSFDGDVVAVTGAGSGLGRHYALDLAAAGARVVVHARRESAAHEVTAEIQAAGGDAVASVGDSGDGEQIVRSALHAFGRVDALVVNAGGVLDRTFQRMSEPEWSEVLTVHLEGARRCAAAVWPMMLEQGSGRLLFTTSGAGLHGNLGQANYAAAKAGIIGLTKTLAIEGTRYGVTANAVAPMAHTPMTQDIFDVDLRDGLRPEQVSAVVVALVHSSCPLTGAVVETGGGWVSALRWERSAGVRFEPDAVSPDAVAARWDEIVRFGADADHPSTTADALNAAMGRHG